MAVTSTEIPTNQPKSSKGWALGLEGNSFIYVLGALVISVGISIVGITIMHIITPTLVVAVLIPTTTYSFIKLFISGKPPHNLRDLIYWSCPILHVYSDRIELRKNNTFTISEYQPRHTHD